MKKTASNVPQKDSTELYQEHQLRKKKPFQEPVLSRHETLVENTHFGFTATAPTSLG